MAFVKHVPHSIQFYKKLGFVEGNTHSPHLRPSKSFRQLSSNPVSRRNPVSIRPREEPGRRRRVRPAPLVPGVRQREGSR